MLLTNEQVAEYQRLYKNRFGENISYADAYEQGVRLVSLMKAIYKPIPKKTVSNENKNSFYCSQHNNYEIY